MFFNILLVEDYEPSILATGIYIDQLGHSYTVSRTGKHAFEQACLATHDLILMDMILPDMHGFEVTRMIREHEQKLSKVPTPIIGLTANDLLGDYQKCLEVGMNDYMPKHLMVQELQSKIMDFCAARKSASDLR